MMKILFRQRFCKCFARAKDAFQSPTSKSGKITLALLLLIAFVISGAGEGRADRDRYEGEVWWQEKVRKLKAEGKDVKIMKSKNMKPEKSPEEFLKRYKKIREKAGDKFTFQTFVEDIARGLVVEQRYHETQGVFYDAKENLNPNYSWKGFNTMAFHCDRFCITPEMLMKIFGKEDRIVTIEFYKKASSYRYFYMGVNFDVAYIPGINKKCASEAIFDSDLFLKMEDRKPIKNKEGNNDNNR